ncbi:MAG: ABC transporter ATP-binding protein [Ruminococcaceae bacterium]|nr:ABC transporter ATP-binding protein [Oscillospiraceae bacterium]
MAKRTLEDLQKQYSRAASAPRGRGFGPGPGGGRRGPQIHGGKPKRSADTVKRLAGYIRPYRLHLVLVLLCMLFSTVASLAASYLIMPIVNRLSGIATTAKDGVFAVLADRVIDRFAHLPFVASLMSHSPYAAAATYLLAALIILLAVYAVAIVSTYVQSRLMLAVSQGAVERIRNDLFQKLQTLPVRFFDRNATGEVMSRFTNDVDNIDVMLNNSLVQLVSGVITLVGTFSFMVTTNWILTLVTVVFVPLFAFGGAAIARRSSKYYSGQQSALGAVNGYIEETVSGQKVIKVFNREEAAEEEFGLLNNDLRDKQFKAQFYGGIMGPVMGNLSQVSYSVTIGVGAVMMVTAGFTPGALTVFAGYSRQFSQPINTLSMQTSTIFAALAGAERVFGVLDEAPETPDAADAQTLPPMKGYVELKNVTFGYTPDKVVLRDISLYAKPGQKIAFVGSTGAGKTTVTNLLNRFYDIDEGQITIDGVDIRKIPRAQLRRNIAMVLQDTHLFTGTVMENIRYGRLDATDEEVVAAAKTASAHSFIMRLSDGYQTMLEGDGANLSQGQRQLLNIARAALSKAPILVLDEATSSVDTRTERHIEHGMDRLMRDRTTFVIAHRLSTVRNANAIMVLEQGRIIERGDHDDLLAQKGRYYTLYTGQVELD